MTGTVGWLDCTAGVSGDMLLAALYDVGADPRPGVDALGLAVQVGFDETDRGGLRAVSCTVRTDEDQPLRTLADIETLLDAAALDVEVSRRARAVFTRLAAAEARVHGVDVDAVHFHEVGALDTVADVVGVCHAMATLGATKLVTSAVALGGGGVDTAHGRVPLPGPAVLELLGDSELVGHGGPDDVETATPTGVALLAEWTTYGVMPSMRVRATGVGAGGRTDRTTPNVVRLVIGAPVEGDLEPAVVLEANVDDLDPRLWPEVIDRLLAAGAADAWLTPIVMKKGRPAHTISALTATPGVAAVREALFRETSTIGVRESAVAKTALDREWVRVQVDGEVVRVKVARLGDTVVNATPEWEDVLAAARALGRPAKLVLAAAAAAAQDACR